MKLYMMTLIILSVIEGVWLGLIAGRFYTAQLGSLMANPIRWPPAIAFYVVYAAGLVIFVIQPALEGGGWPSALKFGAGFGLVSYATYNLTCLAIIRGYPTTVAFLDLAWGTAFTAAVASLAVVLSERLRRSREVQ